MASKWQKRTYAPCKTPDNLTFWGIWTIFQSLPTQPAKNECTPSLGTPFLRPASLDSLINMQVLLQCLLLQSMYVNLDVIAQSLKCVFVMAIGRRSNGWVTIMQPPIRHWCYNFSCYRLHPVQSRKPIWTNLSRMYTVHFSSSNQHSWQRLERWLFCQW